MHLKIRSLGFTLLEMMGVIAIMSILASVMAPSIFKAIDDTFSSAEEENLASLESSLRAYIETSHQIPDDATAAWVAAISNYSNLNSNAIEYNRRDFRRAIYFDPRFFTSTDTAFSGYTQTTGLNSAPVSPRAMIVSDLTANAPNAPTSTTAFDDIWNQTGSATLLENEKVKVHRMYLGDLFTHIVLTNSNAQQSAYSLDSGSNTYAVPAAVGAIDGNMTLYTLKNSPLNLYSVPFPSGGLVTRLTLQSNLSYRFELEGSDWVWKRL